MSARYRIRHRTSYVYADTVTLSHNLAHLAPCERPGQRLISHQLEVDPIPASLRHRSDYFGNRADSFTITLPHDRLTVTSTAEVVVDPVPTPRPGLTLAWDDARVHHGGTEHAAWEYRFDSGAIPCAGELLTYAAGVFIPGRPVLEAALDLTARIHRDFVYDPGATTVSTPVLDALELRRGVCQDFSQVLIGCLRTTGLGARYVSGYLETSPPPGQPRLVGADATHAWAQVWCGPETGWVDLDPTNNCIPGERHITVAFGRDFTDVSPLKGMVLGGGNAEVTVGVDVERLAE